MVCGEYTADRAARCAVNQSIAGIVQRTACSPQMSLLRRCCRRGHACFNSALRSTASLSSAAAVRCSWRKELQAPTQCRFSHTARTAASERRTGLRRAASNKDQRLATLRDLEAAPSSACGVGRGCRAVRRSRRHVKKVTSRRLTQLIDVDLGEPSSSRAQPGRVLAFFLPMFWE